MSLTTEPVDGDVVEPVEVEAAATVEGPQSVGPLDDGAPPAPVWGRLAAVGRTVVWARQQPQRPGRFRFLGPNLDRLLRQALAAEGVDAGTTKKLNAATKMLDGFDGQSPEEQDKTMSNLEAHLLELVPLSQIGAISWGGTGASSELVIPEKRRRRRRSRGRDEEGSAQEGGKGADAKKAGAKKADAKDGDAKDGDGAKADGEEGAKAPPVEAKPKDPDEEIRRMIADTRRRDANKARDQARRAERDGGEDREPRPARHTLGHEEGTGRSLTDLGIEEGLATSLAEDGIETLEDLITRKPTGFARAPVAKLTADLDPADLSEDDVTVRGRVLHRCTRFVGTAARREVTLQVKEHVVLCRWVATVPRGFDSWIADRELALVGKLSLDDGELQLFEAEPVGVDGRGSGAMPTYAGETDDRAIRDLLSKVLARTTAELKDHLPPELLKNQRLLDLGEALRDAHFPANNTERGRTRLAFDELLQLHVALAWRGGRGQTTRGLVHKATHKGIGQLSAQNGIELSDGQERVFSEIRRDLASAMPMTRLLQGEVGAGTGLVALMTAIIVAENRSQVVMVAPNALAAERRFLFAEPLLRGIGLNPVLVGDRPGKGEEDAIRRGEAHVVFGTHALLDPEISWQRLGLLIVEEGGPYGTVSPKDLESHKHRPDLLVVTRAPIPSTLSFSVFGEFDVSVVPPLEKARVKAVVHTAADRKLAYEAVSEALALGRQVEVVFPVKDGADLLGPQDAARMAKALQTEFFPDATVGIFCTAMSRDERTRVVEDFQHRRIDVLVATTYIEEAPRVPNATVCVVEYADMHDLIRLHRLKNHVGFGTHRGQCHMVLSDEPTEQGQEVVRLAATESDGFRIAEYDLKFRGTEALLGDRAAEAPTFVWADPPRDQALIRRTREEAFSLLASDPRLRRWPDFVRLLAARWSDWLGEEIPVPSADAQGGRGGQRRRRRRRRRK
jgi:RecG-like helicase